MSDAPERIWAYAGTFRMWRDHKTDSPYTQIEYVRADRIEKLEDKLSESEALLAKAVEALQGLVPILCEGFEDGCGKLSRHDCAACEGYATLAELTGGKDE